MDKLKFSNGNVLINNIKVILLPINIAIILHKYLLKIDKFNLNKNSNDNNNINNISIKNLSKKIGYNLISSLNENNDNNNNKYNNNCQYQFNQVLFSKYLKYYNLFGFGRVELIYAKKNYILLKNFNARFIEYEKYIFNGNLNDKKSIFFEEQLYGVFEFFNLKIEKFEIIKDKNDLNGYYYKIYYNKKVNPSYVLKENEMKYRLFSKTDKISIHGTTLNKVFTTNQIKNENGQIKLWNIVLNAIPIDILNYFKKYEFNANNNYIKSIIVDIENFGKAQGIIAVKMQRELFGVIDNKQIIQTIIHQAELIGLGKIESCDVSNIDKKIEYKIDNNIEFDSIFSIYFINLILSAIEFCLNKTVKLSISEKIGLLIFEIENKEFKNKIDDKYFELILKNRLFCKKLK